MRTRLYVWVLLGGLALVACREVKPVDPAKVPLRGAEGINVVVEIAAGTNLKVEWQKPNGPFAAEVIDGRERRINFLPYPGNYGFIPGTFMDPARGGDGDALDVLVLCDTRPTGSVQEVIPIAALRLRDRGEIDTKIIAVPVNPEERVISATNYRAFLMEYDGARRILETWFRHYKGFNVTEVIGWEDEEYALREIEQWTQ